MARHLANVTVARGFGSVMLASVHLSRDRLCQYDGIYWLATAVHAEFGYFNFRRATSSLFALALTVPTCYHSELAAQGLAATGLRRASQHPIGVCACIGRHVDHAWLWRQVAPHAEDAGAAV